jgi:hypothetical protein
VAYVGAWRAYYKAAVEAGVYAGGNPLQAPETATTIRQRDGSRHIQDGPYASSKEQLGGFMLLELPSLDAALDWVARCPPASYGVVKVRPLAPEMEQRVIGESPTRARCGRCGGCAGGCADRGTHYLAA